MDKDRERDANINGDCIETNLTRCGYCDNPIDTKTSSKTYYQLFKWQEEFSGQILIETIYCSGNCLRKDVKRYETKNEKNKAK